MRRQQETIAARADAQGWPRVQRPPAEHTATPLVSIVSVAYNRREKMLQLLPALYRQDYTNVEIIIVDNASEDGTAEAVESAYPEVRVIRSGRNLGPVARNLGIAAANGPYILFVDDDGLPAETDWISQVVRRFTLNPRLGAVACAIRMPDTGRLAYDSPQFLTAGDTERGYPSIAFNGTGAGVRTDAVRAIGGYPERYFRDWEELYLCTRLIQAGWEVRYFPSIEVWHCRPSGSSNRPATYHGVRNYLWYIWELYPWPAVLTETARFLAGRSRWLLGGGLASTDYGRAVLDALRGLPETLADRQPLTVETLAYLDWVRRRGIRSAQTEL